MGTPSRRSVPRGTEDKRSSTEHVSVSRKKKKGKKKITKHSWCKVSPDFTPKMYYTQFISVQLTTFTFQALYLSPLFKKGCVT